MITRKAKFVVAFACALVLVTISQGAAASTLTATATATPPSSTIYSFGSTYPIDGGIPKGSLTNVNGVLFGRTTTTTVATPTPTPMAGATPTPIGSYGVIFHVDPTDVASSYSIAHVFADHSDDGADPRHDAMTPFNNLLYGTTLEGGTNKSGIIFSIGQDGTGYQVLMSFAKCSGDESHSCFVVVNNLLYGMTAHGGDNDQGVIFSFNPAGPAPTPTATPSCTPANYQALYAFLCSPPEGAEPHGRLALDPDGTTLYGMTREGGSMGYGVVFKVDTSGNHYTVLHNFMGGHDDGATSDHGYVVQSGHHLYGLTTNGGHHNDGVIFKLNIDDQSFHVLHRFGETNNDGKNPYGSLLLVATAVGDKLYGTTQTGGDNDLGTVFVINTDGHSYQRLYSFGGKANNQDGAKPIDNVIYVNGWLYGMTTEGGAHNLGTIFQVCPNPRCSPTPAPRPTSTP